MNRICAGKSEGFVVRSSWFVVEDHRRLLLEHTNHELRTTNYEPRTRWRRGYTLVEMLLVITGIAILFGISVGMIHLLLRLDRGNRARLGEKATIQRLAAEFRRDAHAARNAEPLVVKDRKGIRLDLGHDRVIEYAEEGGRFIRSETREDATQQREAYRMPSRGSYEISLRDRDGRPWLVLALVPKPGMKAIDPARPVVIEACVGKDERLARRLEDQP